MATQIVKDKSKDPKTAVVSEIRKLIRKGKGQMSFISTLDDKLIYAIFNMVRQGTSSRSIARWMQERDIGVDSSVDSLSRGINKVRKRVAPLLVSPSLPKEGKAKPESNFPSVPMITPGRQLCDFEKVEELVHRYDAVIKEQLAEAENGGVLNANLSKHVNALAALLRVKGKLEQNQDWEMDDLEVTLKKKLDRFTNSLPDGGARLLETGHKILHLLNEFSVEMEEGPDGTYHEVKEPPPKKEKGKGCKYVTRIYRDSEESADDDSRGLP